MSDKDLATDYDCEQCSLAKQKARVCDDSYIPENGPKPRVQINTEVPFMYVERCPVRLIDNETISLWEEYQLFKLTGHLPYSGGYKEQPALLIDAFVFLESLVKRIMDDPSYTRYIRMKHTKKEESIRPASNGQDLINKARKKHGKA